MAGAGAGAASASDEKSARIAIGSSAAEIVAFLSVDLTHPKLRADVVPMLKADITDAAVKRWKKRFRRSKNPDQCMADMALGVLKNVLARAVALHNADLANRGMSCVPGCTFVHP